MAYDPRHLRPSEMVQLLNSTPLGEVTSERQLYRDRQRAGFRIGDGKHLDLVRYVAWLAWERHNPKPSQSPESYAQHKDRTARRGADLSASGRDIGELPRVEVIERRAKAAVNFQYFCEAYFPQSFHLIWSEDHLKVLRKIEQSVLQGGLFAMAMPRGSGKTTICECASIWAVLNGHREFVCLIGSDEGHAMDIWSRSRPNSMPTIYSWPTTPRSATRFRPSMGLPTAATASCIRESARTSAGRRSRSWCRRSFQKGWDGDEALAPFVREDGRSRGSGAIIKVAGITGRIRGMKFKRPDGKSVRPGLVVLERHITRVEKISFTWHYGKVWQIP